MQSFARRVVFIFFCFFFIYCTINNAKWGRETWGWGARARANAWQRQRRNWNEIKLEKLFVEFANAKQGREIEREGEWKGGDGALLAYKHILFYLIWFYIWFRLMLYFTLANNRFVSQSVCMTIRLSLCPTVRPSIHPSIRLPLRLSVCLSLRLSVCLTFSWNVGQSMSSCFNIAHSKAHTQKPPL